MLAHWVHASGGPPAVRASILGAGAAAAAASPLLRRWLAADKPAVEEVIDTAAARGTKQSEQYGGMKIHHAQDDVPTPQEGEAELPPIGGYGDDPVAATSDTADKVKGMAGEAASTAEAAMGKAADVAGRAAQAVGSGARSAAEAARGAVDTVFQETEKVTQPLMPKGDAAHGESPSTSGTTMNERLRWKKEADDAMLGGTPEPGIKLE
ncbi:hypothetical protein ABPG77_003660 [Micractinium sp. CCAP 211/92]